MSYRIEDLGVQAYGDAWLGFRCVVHPRTGEEWILASLSKGGFMVIHPQTGEQHQIGFAPRSECWGTAQAPDGSLWCCGYGASGASACLCRWNWEGDTAELQTELPNHSYFTMDIAPDGCVYAPEYSRKLLHRYNPATGELDHIGPLGPSTRDVACAPDGWVYVTSTNFKTACIIAIDPDTRQPHTLELKTPDGTCTHFTWLRKAADGRVFVHTPVWGMARWYECVGGEVNVAAPASMRLCEMALYNNELQPASYACALAFKNGSYVSAFRNKTLSITKPDGTTHEIAIEREESPLRIFSVEAGGGKIWGGTFIPLTLFSHDIASGSATEYGNPTATSGEIYNMVWSNDKLYMASYTQGMLTRYDPARPYRLDKTPQANPAHLGLMKEVGLPVQRPHGKALAPDGTVFFAAHGGYGCVDSAVVRIDPVTEEITRFLYPDTFFQALAYLPQQKQLLVSEVRNNENGIRFTHICPDSGEICRDGIQIEGMGGVTSWLPDRDNPDLVHGMFPGKGMLFTYSVSRQEVVKTLEEISGYGISGGIAYNMLVDGPDGRIWGQTSEMIFAAERDLSAIECIATYDDCAAGNCYRFGMVYGDDGNLYFPNGTHLMRVSINGTR